MNPLPPNWTCLIPLALALSLWAGCKRTGNEVRLHPEASKMVAAGYSRAVRTSGMVSRSLSLCNQVLRGASERMGSEAGYHLMDGWIDTMEPNLEMLAVPVFLVHAPGRPSRAGSHRAWIKVPDGRKCIIIEEEAMAATLNGPESGGSETTLSVKGEERLAVMMLHEVGHIANGDYGAFDEGVPPDLSSLNLRGGLEKSREFRADSYAAKAIESAVRSTGGNSDGRMAAMSLGMCLSSWSFNLSEERLLENFGATSLSLPSVFWDRGNSHPNIELRILTIQHLLHGNETSGKLLDDFLLHRRAGTKEPRILWQKP